jgi:SagB-type dehydrogenase family enzyme
MYGGLSAWRRRGLGLALLFVALLVASLLIGCSINSTAPTPVAAMPTPNHGLKLSEPKLEGKISLEETLFKRRSARDYTAEALRLDEVSQLLWAAQGITSEWGGRTAPSAGGLYPLTVYLVAGNVENLAAGVYRYDPDGHELVMVKEGDFRAEMAAASLDQSWVKDGAFDIVIAAVYERTTDKYGERGLRYVYMEAGHAAQNICLQATALNLGAVTLGAFGDDQVKETAGMPANENPLYVIPVGRVGE